VIGIHEPQMMEPEILYGTRRRSDIQWIAGVDQDNA
jgi:hypothetical protein